MAESPVDFTAQQLLIALIQDMAHQSTMAHKVRTSQPRS